MSAYVYVIFRDAEGVECARTRCQAEHADEVRLDWAASREVQPIPETEPAE